MKTYKVKDLKIVRPIKLIKTHSYKKFQVPIYNLFYKLGLLPDNEFSKMAIRYSDTKTLKNKLRKMIITQAPRLLYDSALICEKSVYSFSAKDTAVALLDVMNSQYVNVLTNEHYDIHGVAHRDFCDEKTDLIIRYSVLSNKSLTMFLLDEQLEKFKNMDYETRNNLYDEIIESEITLDELNSIIDKIASNEKNSEFIIKTEKTPMSKTYVSIPFYDNVYAYDIDGNMIKPISREIVRTKVLKR